VSKRSKKRPNQKRRNPIARLLRDPLFRARRTADRKKYSRKAKHRKRDERQEASDDST
jgi:stalled ribosome alternative rescue factor ArfA